MVQLQFVNKLKTMNPTDLHKKSGLHNLGAYNYRYKFTTELIIIKKKN